MPTKLFSHTLSLLFAFGFPAPTQIFSSFSALRGRLRISDVSSGSDRLPKLSIDARIDDGADWQLKCPMMRTMESSESKDLPQPTTDELIECACKECASYDEECEEGSAATLWCRFQWFAAGALGSTSGSYDPLHECGICACSNGWGEPNSARRHANGLMPIFNARSATAARSSRPDILRSDAVEVVHGLPPVVKGALKKKSSLD